MSCRAAFSLWRNSGACRSSGPPHLTNLNHNCSNKIMKAIRNIQYIAHFTKPGTIRSLAIIVAVLTAGQSYGGFNQYSIGVKFGTDATGNGGGVPMGAADLAGLPAASQANWNNEHAI